MLKTLKKEFLKKSFLVTSENVNESNYAAKYNIESKYNVILIGNIVFTIFLGII